MPNSEGGMIPARMSKKIKSFRTHRVRSLSPCSHVVSCPLTCACSFICPSHTTFDVILLWFLCFGYPRTLDPDMDMSDLMQMFMSQGGGGFGFGGFSGGGHRGSRHGFG